jgi:alkanesulfonate monooxygenase SsuD/methylene tetrahydromethanopterin reductase-like flavin-dependent oxidoreductase (luciferase family)
MAKLKAAFITPGGTVPEVLEQAEAAEAAGWDGFFYWDGIDVGDPRAPIHDPWVLLAAIAMRTRRVRLSAIVTPLARRRPWKVAREAVTLDHVSGGRFTLAVGLGTRDDGGFSKVGEPRDLRTLAARLDESLEIITGLWSGRPVTFAGEHFKISQPMRFAPRPLQRPRIPVWVVGVWPRPRSMARAYRYDGVLVQGDPDPGAIRQAVGRRRFDVCVFGESAPGDPRPGDLARQGASWWLEEMWSERSQPQILERIRLGPPG